MTAFLASKSGKLEFGRLGLQRAAGHQQLHRTEQAHADKYNVDVSNSVNELCLRHVQEFLGCRWFSHFQHQQSHWAILPADDAGDNGVASDAGL